VERQLVRTDETVVCLVTGSGFKDGGSIRTLVADSAIPTFDVEAILQQ